jgi:hypothetical protein
MSPLDVNTLQDLHFKGEGRSQESSPPSPHLLANWVQMLKEIYIACFLNCIYCCIFSVLLGLWLQSHTMTNQVQFCIKRLLAEVCVVLQKNCLNHVGG